MHFIFSVSLLAAISLQFTTVEGMAVDPRKNFQDRIAKQTIQFSEDTDAICESHRNYRQASVEPTAPQVLKDASGAKEELKIVIKHHKTPTAEEKEQIDKPFTKRPVTSSDENEQLVKDLEKKMDSLESKDKHPKTRSYPESVLHHRGNRYDRPSNGNLEVFLGGSSSESHEHGGYAEPEWQYQGFGNHGPLQDYSHHHHEPVMNRYSRPVNPVVSRYEGNRRKPRVEYPESHYVDSGYKTHGSGSGEYVPKRKSGYRNRDEEMGSNEYHPQRRKGYGSDEEQGYKAKKKSGHKGYKNKPSSYESQEESGYKNYGSKKEKSGYRSESGEDHYTKPEKKHSSEKNSGEDVLVKISVNNDQDSPDLGKVKVDVNKDKELFPDERQLRISVKKDKDLPPGDERDIQLEVKSDHEQEDDEEHVEISVGRDDSESADDRTIVQVKKPRRKCCKKRKNKSSRKRKY